MVILNFNVGGRQYSTTASTLMQEKQSLFNQWFTGETAQPPLEKDSKGAYFIDRDPTSFGIILNYLRLKSTKQLWEACLPKDPDRLALLTQEAEYYKFVLNHRAYKCYFLTKILYLSQLERKL